MGWHMKWTVVAVHVAVGTILVAGSAWGQGKAPAPAGDENCHGPLYHKLKAQDKEHRAAEAARVEVSSFVERLAPVLFEAQRAEIESIMATKHGEYVKCVAGTKKPSPLCVAMASGVEKPCTLLTNPDEQGPCLQLAGFAAALKAHDASLCARIEMPDIRRVCQFVVTDNFTCGELGDGPAADVCAVLAGGDTTKLEELPDEVRGPAHWLLALTRKESSWCAKLGSPEESEACRAALAGNDDMCRPSRPLIEHIDNDYSCRKILGRHSVRQGAGGSELTMLFVSPYKGQAGCALRLRLTAADGSEVVRKLTPLTVPGSGFFTELRQPIGEHRLVEVISDCTWDPESSRIDLRRE
jgi:hypothetical protein